MKILIQQACIIDRSSPHNGTIRDIVVENGRITAIGAGLSAAADKVVRHPGLHVSPGWVDIFSHFCDPGYEHKETLETGAAAAAAGGFTDVFVIPNTRPVVDSKSQVEYIRGRSSCFAGQHPPDRRHHPRARRERPGRDVRYAAQRGRGLQRRASCLCNPQDYC
jgi:dihydroorotase-like cyclic amidohydrolase